MRWRSIPRAGCSSPIARTTASRFYDQDLNLLETGWEQYSRISGLWIEHDDMLYAADSESGSVNPAHGAWKRGIRIGSVKDGKDGKIQFFIPDPQRHADQHQRRRRRGRGRRGEHLRGGSRAEGAQEIRQEVRLR